MKIFGVMASMKKISKSASYFNRLFIFRELSTPLLLDSSLPEIQQRLNKCTIWYSALACQLSLKKRELVGLDEDTIMSLKCISGFWWTTALDVTLLVLLSWVFRGKHTHLQLIMLSKKGLGTTHVCIKPIIFFICSLNVVDVAAKLHIWLLPFKQATVCPGPK